MRAGSACASFLSKDITAPHTVEGQVADGALVLESLAADGLDDPLGVVLQLATHAADSGPRGGP